MGLCIYDITGTCEISLKQIELVLIKRYHRPWNEGTPEVWNTVILVFKHNDPCIHYVKKKKTVPGQKFS